MGDGVKINNFIRILETVELVKKLMKFKEKWQFKQPEVYTSVVVS